MLDRRALIVRAPLGAAALMLSSRVATGQDAQTPVLPPVPPTASAGNEPFGPLTLKKGSLTPEQIRAISDLFQSPQISASCPENCGCNEACGCKKDNCCEYKCQCDGKGQSLIPDAGDLWNDTKFQEILKKFNPEQLKTLEQYEELSREINREMLQP